MAGVHVDYSTIPGPQDSPGPALHAGQQRWLTPSLRLHRQVSLPLLWVAITCTSAFASRDYVQDDGIGGGESKARSSCRFYESLCSTLASEN